MYCQNFITSIYIKIALKKHLSTKTFSLVAIFVLTREIVR